VDGLLPSTPLISLPVVVLDTETTGLDARKARIVQIGALRLVGGQIVNGERYETLVDPGLPIPPETTQVHGISDADVRGAPRFADAWPRLEAYLGQSIVIGHTIGYDFAIIERELERIGSSWSRPRSLDLRLLAQVAVPTLADYALDHICQALDVEVRGRHTAMGDAEATAEAFLRLVPLLRQGNIRTLGEAYAAMGRLIEREAKVSATVTTMTTAAPLSANAEDIFGTIARVDTTAYQHTVRDVLRGELRWATPQQTCLEAVRQMIDHRVSSLLIAGDDNSVGIVTERDLLRAISADGVAALAAPVGLLQSKPVTSISANAFLYRAIARMKRIGTRHLGVLDESGRIVGVVSARDLVAGRAQAAMILGDEIRTATTASELAAAWSRLPSVALKLLAEGVEARTMTAIISEEIRLLTRRCAELAEQQMRDDGHGEPPVPFAVLLLGSAGRGESMLAPDQDNAIVYRGTVDDYGVSWFLAFGRAMNELLDAAGIPLCKGGVMAGNADWCRSVESWRTQIDQWLERTSSQDLLNVDIFFDAMPVYGDLPLGREIWRYAYERAREAPRFLNLLTEHAREPTNPFTFFGAIRHDDRGRLDLKKIALFPIVAAARVMSIRHAVEERSTVRRLDGVRGKEVYARSDIDLIDRGHEQLLRAVLNQQISDIAAGVSPSTRVEITSLSREERTALKQAIGAAATAAEVISEGRI
jgi:CBS domain-containing protein